MVFWIGAMAVALTIAAATAWRLIRRAARPAWPSAVGFALASLAALGAAVMATVTSLETPHAPQAIANAETVGGHGETAAAGKDNFESLVTRLEAGLKENPDDPPRWALLGRSYVALGRLQEATAAFGEAVTRTTPPDPGLIGEYGEALIAAANGRIAGAPEAAFAQVLTLQPDDPRARYYLAVARAEKGDPDGARQDLEALLSSAPADAPWRATVADRLRELTQPSPQAASGETPEASAPAGPTAEDIRAAQDMSPEARAEMIRGMVSRLAQRMTENPNDFPGWIRLANAYRTLGEETKAGDALKNALLLQPANVGLLIQYAEVLIAAANGGVTPEAEKVLNRAAARQPGNPQVLWRLGQAAAARGDTEAARRTWQELLPKLLEADPLKAEVRAALDAL